MKVLLIGLPGAFPHWRKVFLANRCNTNPHAESEEAVGNDSDRTGSGAEGRSGSQSQGKGSGGGAEGDGGSASQTDQGTEAKESPR